MSQVSIAASASPPGSDGKRRPGNPNWVKGVSGNPRGRPKTGTAFAEAVREHVDPLELIRLALEIARGAPAVRDLQYLRLKTEAEAKGEPPPSIEGVEVVWPSQAERLSAIAFLHGAGWQKPPQGIEIGAPERRLLDPTKLTPDELDELERTLAKAAGILDVPSIERAPDPAPARALPSSSDDER